MMCSSERELGPTTAGPGNCTSPIYLAAGNEGSMSVLEPVDLMYQWGTCGSTIRFTRAGK